MSIDFKLMGLDNQTSEFLNKCLEHRDNLESTFKMNIFGLRSASAELHFTDMGVLAEIERHYKDKIIKL